MLLCTNKVLLSPSLLDLRLKAQIQILLLVIHNATLKDTFFVLIPWIVHPKSRSVGFFNKTVKRIFKRYFPKQISRNLNFNGWVWIYQKITSTLFRHQMEQPQMGPLKKQEINDCCQVKDSQMQMMVWPWITPTSTMGYASSRPTCIVWSLTLTPWEKHGKLS